MTARRAPERPPHPGRGAAPAAGVGVAALAVAALAMAACGPGAADRARSPARSGADSATAVAASAPAGARPSLAATAGAAPDSVCAAVAAWWGRGPGATVHRADTLVTPWLGEPAVAACAVTVHEEHGLRRDAGGAPDSLAAALGAGLTLARASGPGWVELVRYMADGPDGSSSRFQRGSVRCAVALGWDGGDDSDSTYVPEDWYEEETVCWSAPEGITTRDTAP